MSAVEATAVKVSMQERHQRSKGINSSNGSNSNTGGKGRDGREASNGSDGREASNGREGRDCMEGRDVCPKEKNNNQCHMGIVQYYSLPQCPHVHGIDWYVLYYYPHTNRY